MFGVGLVKTAEDFGVQGERPSHPELLDWLAVELMESGWDIKRLVRLIVSSQTYRQTSRVSSELLNSFHNPGGCCGLTLGPPMSPTNNPLAASA